MESQEAEGNDLMHHFHGAGFVYFVQILDCRNSYKIGFTRNILKRMKQLMQIYNEVFLIDWIYSDDAFWLESEIQDEFHRNSNWNCFQAMMKSRSIQRMPPIPDRIFSSRFLGYGELSCEFFYLKPKKVFKVLEKFDAYKHNLIFA
jgi:hypothetical protein